MKNIQNKTYKLVEKLSVWVLSMHQLLFVFIRDLFHSPVAFFLNGLRENIRNLHYKTVNTMWGKPLKLLLNIGIWIHHILYYLFNIPLWLLNTISTDFSEKSFEKPIDFYEIVEMSLFSKFNANINNALDLLSGCVILILLVVLTVLKWSLQIISIIKNEARTNGLDSKNNLARVTFARIALILLWPLVCIEILLDDAIDKLNPNRGSLWDVFESESPLSKVVNIFAVMGITQQSNNVCNKERRFSEILNDTDDDGIWESCAEPADEISILKLCANTLVMMPQAFLAMAALLIWLVSQQILTIPRYMLKGMLKAHEKIQSPFLANVFGLLLNIVSIPIKSIDGIMHAAYSILSAFADDFMDDQPTWLDMPMYCKVGNLDINIQEYTDRLFFQPAYIFCNSIDQGCRQINKSILGNQETTIKQLAAILMVPWIILTLGISKLAEKLRSNESNIEYSSQVVVSSSDFQRYTPMVMPQAYQSNCDQLYGTGIRDEELKSIEHKKT